MAFYPKQNLIVGPLTWIGSFLLEVWHSLAKEGTTEGL